jgi:hypothetical protein
VGVCTQDESLRAKFTGTADKVVNLISFYATEPPGASAAFAYLGNSEGEGVGMCRTIEIAKRGKTAGCVRRPAPNAPKTATRLGVFWA